MSAPLRPAPPKPAPKPGQVKVVRAMYTYEAQYDDELSFDEGDVLYIGDKSNKDWWMARCGGKKGLIPANYVEENTENIANPLHEACKRGNMAFLLECIDNGVSVNGLDKAGSTPLHWAAHGGHTECLQRLLADPRCELNVQNKLGDTALHSAAWKGHADCVQQLLKRGCRVDLKNKDGKTAFDLASNPQTGALLQTVRPRVMSQDYGDSDDSD